METLTLGELEPGASVRFVDHRFNAHPISTVSVPISRYSSDLAGKLILIIAVAPDNPGKQLAVYSKDPIGGHSCDGRVPNGHGLYVLPEQLYTEESYQEHKCRFEEAIAKQIEIDRAIEEFGAAEG